MRTNACEQNYACKNTHHKKPQANKTHAKQKQRNEKADFQAALRPGHQAKAHPPRGRHLQ
jgi:hypothetical protein